MNERIEKIAEQVISGIRNPLSADKALIKALENSDREARPRVIREEVSKTVWIADEDTIIGTCLNFDLCDSQAFGKADEEKQWEEICRMYEPYQNKLLMQGGNHKSANFEYILQNGLLGHMQHIVQQKQAVTDSKQITFLDDLHYICKIIIAWCNAHADACRTLAQRSVDEQRREELIKLAQICERVPLYPAESFQEAIQSYWFIFMLFPDGVGRLDQYLNPFYQADIEKGVLTRQKALELIEELLLKIFCTIGTGLDWSGNNHGVLAGYCADGTCGHNECTEMILEAVTELPTWRPQFSYRVTRHTTLEQFKSVLEANCKRPDLIMFLNDDVIVQNLVKVGVAFEDAVNYSKSGCNETIVTGCSQMGNIEGHVNIVNSFERVMRDSEALKGYRDFEAFYQSYEKELEKDLKIVFGLSDERGKQAALYSDPIQSLCTDGCIASATPITQGGAKYNYCTWCLTGVVNMADSMSIIRQMVFEENKFTLAEIGEFLRADWKGYEKQRAYILNNGRYFGNDDDYVDGLINRIGASVNKIAEKYTPFRGGSYLFGTLTGYELSHIVFGENTGATPDGRYAKDPLAASIAAYPDADKNGMTSYLKSAAKIDGNLFSVSVVVNLKLDRALTDSAEKRARLAAIIMTYMRLGGVQLQLNYLSADELICAKKEPDKYRNLRVRVTGFSGFFTTLDENLQDELIRRTRHEG